MQIRQRNRYKLDVCHLLVILSLSPSELFCVFGQFSRNISKKSNTSIIPKKYFCMNYKNYHSSIEDKVDKAANHLHPAPQ